MSKKYKEELDKIVMDEEMKKRILHNVLNKNIESKSITPIVHKNNSIKKNIQVAIACFTAVVCLSVVKIYPDLFKNDNSKAEKNQVIKNSDDEINVSKSNEKSESNDNLDNSSDLECGSFFIQEYKTLEETEDTINLKIDTIKVLPKGFYISNISVISNEIIQIEYSNGEDNIIFRAGKDIDNISGDYNIYKIKNAVKVNGIDVDLEGNKETVFNLADWKKGSISYSISAANGIDEDEMLNMIKSIV